MDLSDRDLHLISALCGGLSLEAQPYRTLGQAVGMDEAEVIARLHALRQGGVIRRLGVIVRHHELGYRANAMVVWDIPDAEVAEIGRRLGACDEVSLCYRRPRRLPSWPYNLFAMVHARDAATAQGLVDQLAAALGPLDRGHRVLFSTRILKKTGLRLT